MDNCDPIPPLPSSLRIRSRSSSPPTEKLVRTELHHASIFDPSLKFRLRFVAGEIPPVKLPVIFEVVVETDRLRMGIGAEEAAAEEVAWDGREGGE